MRGVLLLLSAACALTSACPAPDVQEQPPVSLALQFVTRQSCGRISALDYDTSCAHAIYVLVRDAARKPLYDRCIELDAPPADLGELLQGEPLLSLGGLTANRSVYFEVRAFHGTGLEPAEKSALCGTPAQKDHWLFWGESELIDLSAYASGDAGSALIPVVVDCRDCSQPCVGGECFGCLAMSPDEDAICPAIFPPSVCAPASAALCGIPCDDDSDCFEGAQRCIDSVCDTTDTSGTLCARCAADGPPCLAGLTCVARPGEEEGVCAPACPDTTCVKGTKCTRIGNNLDVVEAAAPP